MPSLTNPQIALVSIFVESLCYGIYLATFGISLRFLLWKRYGYGLKSWSQVNKLMLVISLLLFVTATTNLCFNVVRGVESSGPSRTSVQFTDIGSPEEVAKVFCVNFQTFLGDFILTYRYWVIYGKSWKQTAFPIVLWFGVVATGILNVVVMREIHDKEFTAPSAMRPIIISFWVISITLNIFCTSRIAWRLYSVDHELRDALVSQVNSRGPVSSQPRRKPSRLRSAMGIIIQSGLIYTTCAFITCVMYIDGSPAVFITAGTATQSVGIAFNLIIVRVAVEDHLRSQSTDTHGASSLRFGPNVGTTDDVERDKPLGSHASAKLRRDSQDS
ncbi:hypothetical protein VNI00_006501 [Paramarasmius palmivorus]|uniref:Taste receptor type 2 n=1 Tax=Paramarasmius palmivorus TaxID=297713 RepID=A0AAW0D861_9AGAR